VETEFEARRSSASGVVIYYARFCHGQRGGFDLLPVAVPAAFGAALERRCDPGVAGNRRGFLFRFLGVLQFFSIMLAMLIHQIYEGTQQASELRRSSGKRCGD
jgi:hypothetical protein